MRNMRVSSLQWAIGALCTLLGALMLVAPHQFNYILAWRAYLPIWGAGFLLAGLALLSLTMLLGSRRLAPLAHGLAGLLLLTLAASFWPAGAWLGSLQYGGLGLGTLVAAWLPRNPVPTQGRRPDLLSLVLGLTNLAAGLAFLVAPQPFDTRLVGLSGGPVRGLGAAFLLGGALLAGVQFFKRLRQGFPRAAAWAIYEFNALLLFGFALFAIRTDQTWLAAIYCVFFAIALAVLPWLETRLHRFSPSTLRTRLGLALGIAAAAPLVLAVSLAGAREESSARAEALNTQQTRAFAIAGAVSNYVRLHRAGLETLAAESNLTGLPPAEQARRLQDYANAYPDAILFGLYDSQGRPIATSQTQVAPADISESQVFQQARLTNQPALEVINSTDYGTPVFLFGQPMNARGEGFTGFALFVLPADRLGQFLAAQTGPAYGEVYLVDDQGRVIAHSDPSEASTLQAFGEPDLLAAMRGSSAGAFSHLESGRGPEELAAFARVQDLDWTVVVEYPSDQALASMYAGRNLAFGVLLVFLIITLAVSVLISAQLTAPLGALALAAQELAAGNIATPLPSSPVRELQRLTAAFAEMRARLAVRSADRQLAEQAMRQAHDELEERVIARTLALRRAGAQLDQLNQQLAGHNLALQWELAEGRQAAASAWPGQEQVTRFTAWDGLLLTDPAGNLVVWNQALEEYSGLPEAETLGQPVWEILQRGSPAGEQGEAQSEQLRQSVQTALQAGQAAGFGLPRAYVIQHEGGRQRALQGISFAFRDGSAWAVGIIFRAGESRLPSKPEGEQVLQNP